MIRYSIFNVRLQRKKRLKMDVNFCIPGLTATIKSSCVPSDGYDVDNLISSDFYKKQRGFLAERFIKPPVTLNFEFVCDIQINYLVIQSNVGAQKSAGLEVFTTKNFDVDSGLKQDTELNSVASGIIRNGEDGFVFYKHGYDVRQKIPASNFVFCTFKSSRNLGTKVLIIKIFKTYGSSIPALGKVEVWGRPNPKCPKNVIDKVYTCWNHFNQHFNQAFPVLSNAQITSNYECDSKTDVPVAYSVDFKIPDEFLDPITCEIMLLPVILPSGKIIDKFTLEKHNETESHWGRSPSDPFTGIQFSEVNKPVFASDLKTRIDKFLCDNSNEKVLLNVPRTVGKKASSFMEVCHRTEQKVCENHESYCDKFSQESNQKNCDLGSVLTDSRKCDKGRTAGSFVPSTFGNPQISTQQKCIPKEIQPYRSSVVSQNIKFRPYAQNSTFSRLSHEEMSEKSLDNLLKTTLSTLQSVSQTTLNENITSKCVICRNNNNLFQMPCIHVLCRSCLVDMVNKKQLNCADCEVEFKASDVRRIHF